MKTPAVSSPRTTREAVFVCGLLAAVTLLAFSPLRLNQFIDYDDQQYITANPQVLRGLSWEGVGWAFTSGHSANWHPITWLSHMLDVQLFGTNPAAHHGVNLMFHIANSMLLFLFLRRITGAMWRSAVVAFLFALHPMRVESVAWAAERKDVLSTFFGLLSLRAYSEYALRAVSDAARHLGAEPPSTARWTPGFFRSRCYLASLACFALALMSKPMLVTLPGVMLLLDAWPLRRIRLFNVSTPKAGGAAAKIPGLMPLLVEKMPYLVLAGCSSVVTLMVQQKAMMFYKNLPLSSRVANALVSGVRYLELAFWPKSLAVLYPHPAHWATGTVVAAAAVLLVVTGVALKLWRRFPYVAIGWLWYLGMLVPVLGLVQVGIQSMADRYSYLPLVGIFMLVVWAATDVLERARVSPRWGIAAAGLLLSACAILTWRQVQLWRDTRTLFAHTARVTSKNWLAEYKLAVVALQDYENTGRKRIEDQVSPVDSSPPERNQADTLAFLQEIIRRCENALQAEPRVLDVHVTLAKALTEMGRVDEARGELEVATRIDPKNAAAHENLAEVLYRQGHVREAVAEYKTALALEPNWQSVLNNLAWILATDRDAQIRDGNQAVVLAELACNLSSQTNLWFQHTRAAAYAEKGDFLQATAAAQQALELAKSSGNADLSNIAATRLELYKKGQQLRAP